MAARGVAEMMSRISKEEEGWRDGDPEFMVAADGDWFPLQNVLFARMSCSGEKVTSGEEFRAVAHRRSRSSRGGAKEREYVGRMKCETAGGERPGYI
jgi:hypothetical protein